MFEEKVTALVVGIILISSNTLSTPVECPQKPGDIAGQLDSHQELLQELDPNKARSCPGHAFQDQNFNLLNGVIKFNSQDLCKELGSRRLEMRPTDWIEGTDKLSNSSGDDAVCEGTLTDAIKKNCRTQHTLDGLSLSWRSILSEQRTKETKSFKNEFSIGCFVDQDGHRTEAYGLESRFSKPDTYYIFNHFDFVITYDVKEYMNEDGGRITSIRLNPKSKFNCGHTPMAISGSLSNIRSLNVTHSYSVTFVKDGSHGSSVFNLVLFCVIMLCTVTAR